ncbi:EAL domain-containing protein [Sulfurospirillum arcachonense]|uniref:EAL domain-containing protein n=1 Tax=Sulfurospirillum arcachonense TaxID=57666 RepID=UPI0004B97DA7|nr:GGDEF domain-containing phosphodiesterase [Sulfurospirillum arcachonense]
MDIEKLKHELESTKLKLMDQFYVDYLSSLPNLYKLRNDLENNSDFTLIMLNIDNFKILNDFYGFIVGDFILESVANKLQNFFKGEQVYRVSSDEFAIVLNKRLSFYELKDYLVELSKKISHLEFNYSKIDIFVDSTLSSSASRSNDNIFSKVNMALKYAKEEGLKFWIYEDNMNLGNEYESNLKFAIKVRKALNNAGLIPYFQPIVDNKTEKIVKYEALSRLVDSDGIVYPPEKFIPVSKKIKVYDKVTKEVINKTFEIFKDNDLEFSINLSFEDIMNQEIYQFIINKLKKSDIGPRVTFELLESEKVQDFQKVVRFFDEIKRHGVKVAIDDFGSGFSNFSYMTNLSPDYIKIDGSLIRNLDVDENAQIVVETIVSFSKKLGIKTVAEYVHSSTILSTVKNMGIDYSQGFYIDQPKPQITF